MEKAIAAVVALGVLLGIVAVGFEVVAISTKNTITCTVDSKDRTSNGSSSSSRVYTTDCGVLQVKDSITTSNYHSSDTYASIKAGKRYEFKTQGIRVPFFSMFPNILEATEVTN